MFSHMRESENGEIERKESFGLSTVGSFFVTLEFLTPTISRYKTEARILKEKTETAIKFSIDSFFPKFLHLNMRLPLLET